MELQRAILSVVSPIFRCGKSAINGSGRVPFVALQLPHCRCHIEAEKAVDEAFIVTAQIFSLFRMIFAGYIMRWTSHCLCSGLDYFDKVEQLTVVD